MRQPPIKLIAIDLDGTLLYEHREIRPRNAAAIRAACAQGVTVTIATGRMFRSAARFAAQLGIDVPLLTYQGALIRTLGGETLLEQPIPRDLARRVVAYAQGRGLTVQAYINDCCCVSQINQHSAAYAIRSRIPLMSCGDLASKLPHDAHKVLCMGEADLCDAVWHECRERFGEELYITKSMPTYLEFMAKGASKGDALQFFAEKMGIKKEEIMAIGDNLNDIELFAAAGCKVAMGNAVDRLKELADYVTADCAEDGVAQAIEKLVLQGDAYVSGTAAN